ncbi:YicC/YloC family endoribonuclease [Veillonella sp. R32]|uniref:YicC/YloC family endoribonuclease n=1 Tax=Veillonella sp. R32 TaxID=2021312 RepID=UPI001389A20A|nr:YicC/YloC family endoribonuclease [Veillonella sp. R32]KAF1679323.1 YicC family protein [Veillonella sp. R32]
MNSMTGFGRGIGIDESLQIIIEIKSVNSRFLDLHLNMPATLYFLENTLRRHIKDTLQRGKVEVNVTLKNTSDREKVFTVNNTLADQIRDFLVVQGFSQTKERASLRDMMSVSQDWLVLEDIPFEEAKLEVATLDALKTALAGLCDMRALEGANLKAEIEGRVNTLEAVLQEVMAHKDIAVKKYEERLLQRIQNVLEKTDVTVNMDRFLQEVATMSDKTDITEEIVRFGSHVVQLRNTLKENQPIGRKLDFLLQEMNREVNTMGSKGSDLAITDRVVVLKCELEKIREQIQNIE